MHDRLDANQRLPADEARELRLALKEVREAIRREVPEIGTDPFSPDDFLALDFDNNSTDGIARRSFWGSPVPVTRRDSNFVRENLEIGTGGQKQDQRTDEKAKDSKRRSRPPLRSLFQAVSIPIDNNRRKIHLEFQKSCKNAELRLCVDENVDATCDVFNRDEDQAVHFTEVVLEGKVLKKDSLVHKDNDVVGIVLGDIVESQTIDLEVCYFFPEGLSAIELQDPVLRVEVIGAPTNDSKLERKSSE